MYLVSGTWYQVPGTWSLVPGSMYRVPGTWYQARRTWPGIRYLVFGTRYLVPSTWYLVPDLTWIGPGLPICIRIAHGVAANLLREGPMKLLPNILWWAGVCVVFPAAKDGKQHIYHQDEFSPDKSTDFHRITDEINAGE